MDKGAVGTTSWYIYWGCSECKLPCRIASEQNYPCSHKALEWKVYRENKKDGDGTFPPSKYCGECEESKQLKSQPPSPKTPASTGYLYVHKPYCAVNKNNGEGECTCKSPAPTERKEEKMLYNPGEDYEKLIDQSFIEILRKLFTAPVLGENSQIEIQAFPVRFVRGSASDSMIVILNNQRSIWFTKKNGEWIYDGWEFGDYKESWNDTSIQ